MGTLPFAVELVHQVATNDAAWLEHGMHRRFAKRHVRGEWYALTTADVTRIVAVVRCDRPQLLRRPKARKRRKRIPGRDKPPKEVLYVEMEALLKRRLIRLAELPHRNRKITAEAIMAIRRYVEEEEAKENLPPLKWEDQEDHP